ncbi:MAG: FtsQ-type POTRA domain-containing protein [Opitutus sp.]
MNRTLLNAPATRSWRDIPQPIKPRAMSPGGRWRLCRAVARLAVAVILMAAMAWGGWVVVDSLQQEPKQAAGAAKGVPLRAPELKTDGVLDEAWLADTLALPARVTLMELDLDHLRSRLLADAQVLTATLTRKFPDRLTVHITERAPVARVMAEWSGRQLALLVARDGAVFVGDNYDSAWLKTLPWLDGVSITRGDEGFLPIAGIRAAGDLMAKARIEAEHLYRTWNVISLARLESDHEIEVRTMSGVTVIFSARADYLNQLARLDYMLDQLPLTPGMTARIDLSLGREVPVRLDLAPVGEPSAALGEPAKPAPTFLFLPSNQPKTTREF